MARKPWETPITYNEDRFYDDDEMQVNPVFSDGIPELEPFEPDYDPFDDEEFDELDEDPDACLEGGRILPGDPIDDESDEEFGEDDDAESED